jgi:hypothetical protein
MKELPGEVIARRYGLTAWRDNSTAAPDARFELLR